MYILSISSVMKVNNEFENTLNSRAIILWSSFRLAITSTGNAILKHSFVSHRSKPLYHALNLPSSYLLQCYWKVVRNLCFWSCIQPLEDKNLICHTHLEYIRTFPVPLETRIPWSTRASPFHLGIQHNHTQSKDIQCYSPFHHKLLHSLS